MKNSSFSSNFQSIPGQLSLAREFVNHSLDKLESKNKTDILIAIGEALQNIVRHAYINTEPGDFCLTISRLNNQIEVIIKDDAPPGKPELYINKRHSASELGGMGIDLIKKITLEFKCEPQPDGNITTLRFKP